MNDVLQWVSEILVQPVPTWALLLFAVVVGLCQWGLESGRASLDRWEVNNIWNYAYRLNRRIDALEEMAGEERMHRLNPWWLRIARRIVHKRWRFK